MTILVINGHPNLHKSYANAEILEQINQQTNWQIVNTAAFEGGISKQQQQLLQAKLIIVQFPLYWSTFPSVLKEWIDQIFTYGFAFGPQGSQLKGKPVIFSITAGATAESYSATGFNFMPFYAYQQAFEHAFKTAQMHILETVITFEMNAIAEEGGNLEQTLVLARKHADKLCKIVNFHLDNSL